MGRVIGAVMSKGDGDDETFKPYTMVHHLVVSKIVKQKKYVNKSCYLEFKFLNRTKIHSLLVHIYNFPQMQTGRTYEVECKIAE